ncbi:NAD(P)(+) transhydrogenase (Re/Si-specific) subunit beta [Myxococcus sp. CA033]|uniref:NAD(P)(+) transhydrogenase (Re/Si-specific) subunit beta n=1 Tax=Myxococcus sp. CA033 TaxID=2741516 RepID=UPI00157B3148|nr:NAD(P)(+) transhydrogenase (Re/Si-specific) subunit beta [Myxococcus sp. CA033]NTX35668.1 NAD(P)(+) transhydrogenase (Re/Si-specific) subunit beta [Myxococcus sp. CA033]
MTLSLTETFVQLLYLGASILFVLGLKDLGDAQTARRGVLLAEIGMVAAVAGTLLYGVGVTQVIVRWEWIVVALLIGSAVGTGMGLWIPMTKMPERIALSHAFGGLAVGLVGVVEYLQHGGPHMSTLQITATGLEVALGALTFSGSIMAFGKLQGFITGRPVTYPGQNISNMLMIVGTLGLIGFLVYSPDASWAFYSVATLGVLLGVLLVLPIGGADMPVVICLLNSYAGLAAAATGFALGNNVLIICGALDGFSGFLLGMMMSKAMNRSFANVLFGAFGAAPEAKAVTEGASASGPAPNVGSVEEAAEVLRAARSVIVVPGYGMAVSQAQHAVRDLANVLQANGCDVRYAIHPVAGRMPGHMNVLLAEANVPYDHLFDLDVINDDFTATDVALVVGANDVVNPAARSNQSSPIYGMPILSADMAKTCVVLKRSLNPGFAGIENELFVRPNTMMVLGDAKKTLMQFTSALKE